jgi:hypothetical protein
MPPKRSGPLAKKDLGPLVAEFQQCCKVVGFQEEERINQVNAHLCHSETVVRLVNIYLSAPLCKVLLRLFQRYQRLQQIIFYSCPIQDVGPFLKQLSNEFGKCPANSLSLDYMPIQRDAISPILATQGLEVLSLRGNQCLTSYDFETHAPRPFSTSLNTFFNALSSSTIKVLNLYGCHIGDDGAIGFARSLFFNTNLVCISLARNRIGDAGARALASALNLYLLNEQESALVDKFVNDESKNRISDEGGSLVKRKKGTRAPPKRPPPKSTKRGAQAKQQIDRAINFDPAAPVMPAVLTKWNTCVAAEGGQKAIPGNTVVTSLILDENLIGEIGVAALREMLARNARIVQFSIASNPEVPADVAESLARRVPIERTE